MSAKGKGAGKGAPRKAEQFDFTAWAAELRVIKRPEGWLWIREDDRVLIRDLINTSIRREVEEDALVPRIKLLWEPDIPDSDWLPLVIEFGNIVYLPVVIGWRPLSRVEATDRLGDAERLQEQVGARIREGIEALQKLTGRSLLADGRAHALRVLQAAQGSLHRLCEQSSKSAQDPELWVNEIPETAQIEGIWRFVDRV